jgi:hypothetical protein
MKNHDLISRAIALGSALDRMYTGYSAAKWHADLANAALNKGNFRLATAHLDAAFAIDDDGVDSPHYDYVCRQASLELWTPEAHDKRLQAIAVIAKI